MSSVGSIEIKTAITLSQINNYLQNDINVIPVTRDPGSEYDKRPVTYLLPKSSDGENPEVTKFQKGDQRGWHVFQNIKVSEKFADYWQGQCNALAIICGNISGRILFFDVDVKNHEDPDKLFSDISDIMSSQFGDWSRFPLVRTPSGGWHIVVKLSAEAEMIGNMKVASSAKGKYFLEIRGEGGYALAPDSPGYQLLSGDFRSIPIIGQAEFDNLLSAFIQLGTFEESYQTTKKDNSVRWEDKETPWDQYDQTDDFRDILMHDGWQPVQAQNGAGFEYWRRPGKDCSHSATWNAERRMFHIFSSNTTFPDSDKSYRPSQILTFIKFDGNFKASSSWLRSQGFGSSWSSEQQDIITKEFVVKHSLEDIKLAFKKSGLFDQNEIPKAVKSIEAKHEIKKSVYQDAPTEFLPLLDRLHPIDFVKEISEALKIEPKKISDKQRRQLIIRHIVKALNQDDTGLIFSVQDKSFYIFYQFWRFLDEALVRLLLSYATEVCGINPLNHDSNFNDQLFRSLVLKLTTQWPDRNDKTILPFMNGTLYVEKGKHEFIEEFAKSDFCRSQLPYDFDPEADSPKWKKFLNEVLVDKSVQSVYQESTGYCLTKDMKFEKAFYIVGGGSNGKSVACDVVTAALGKENVSNLSMEELTKGNKPESMRLMLRDKLVNYCSESGREMDTTMAKRLFSGEETIAWVLHKGPVKIIPPKFIINVNKLTQTVEHNEAFFRRVIVIEFDQTIAKENRNINLAKEIIADELPGVFNWMLKGMERLVMNGHFSQSDAVDGALDKYQEETNVVTAFLKDRYVRTHKGIELIEGKGNDKTLANDGGVYPERTKLRDLYSDFKTWWNMYGGGRQALQQKTFKERLLRAKCPTDKARSKMMFVEHKLESRTLYFYVTKCNCDKTSYRCYHEKTDQS